MRIISGKYKGKKLDGYDIVGTRPTMDRVKESLFATIQSNIKESICLDLFAGSGNLGLEAISNGAKKCYFVDNNNIAIKVLNKNIKELNDKNCIVMNNDYENALKEFSNKNIKFDIIFLDPPYSLNLINPSLNSIKKYNLLSDDGIIICEYESEILDDSLFNLIKEKKYGSKLIKIYRNY